MLKVMKLTKGSRIDRLPFLLTAMYNHLRYAFISSGTSVWWKKVKHAWLTDKTPTKNANAGRRVAQFLMIF